MGNVSALFAKPQKVLLLLLFQCCSLFLWAQARISGKVTDASSKGIPNISVQVQNTTFGTTTDDQGAYTLSANLKPGNYQLVFTGVGFRSTSQAVQIGSAATYT